MRAKDENGNFRDEEFDFYAWGRDYTEGSAWQNSFAVYHDIEGLNKLYGGKLQEKIDELVNTPAYYSVGGYEKEIHEMSEMAACDFGQCAISNQPSFHIPYIYSELGNVAKTAELVEKLCGVFNSTEEGFPGDEDNGSMGAWYVLSCLGFYQMCPSRPDFTMSLPLFDSIKVKLANKNVLTITKARLEAEKIKNKVAYFDIMKGGDLESIALK
jgi:putative alpha-1,2-mannosidase